MGWHFFRDEKKNECLQEYNHMRTILGTVKTKVLQKIAKTIIDRKWTLIDQ